MLANWSNGVLEHWSVGLGLLEPLLQHSITPALRFYLQFSQAIGQMHEPRYGQRLPPG